MCVGKQLSLCLREKGGEGLLLLLLRAAARFLMSFANLTRPSSSSLSSSRDSAGKSQDLTRQDNASVKLLLINQAKFFYTFSYLFTSIVYFSHAIFERANSGTSNLSPNNGNSSRKVGKSASSAKASWKVGSHGLCCVPPPVLSTFGTV